MRLTRFIFLQSKESKLDITAFQAPKRFLLMRDGFVYFSGRQYKQCHKLHFNFKFYLTML